MPTESSRPTAIRVPALAPKQREMLENQSRVVWIGTGTKTGKTTALALWIADGILKGERCAWIGPWHQRTRTGFEAVKSFLSVPLSCGDAVALESTCQIRAGKGRLDTYSGDNAEAVFGEGYNRVVVDEASRMKETILPAVLTTISATKGKVRFAFNLERGRKNWAIANLLRVRAMTSEERSHASEDSMTFPTLESGFVDAGLIEQMRGKMPEAIWRALYLGEIPTDDLALFRGLDEIFMGQELTAPVQGRSYHMGLDLARKADFTVATVMDDLGNVVACDRFNEISWTIQYDRAAALYRRFSCSKAVVDATGVGDPVSEELRKRGIYVEDFIFTGSSKKALVESLVVACDSRAITIPATPRFSVFREELEAFEYVLDGSEVKYGAPSGMHDDTVMSLALAVHRLRIGAREDGVLGLYRLWDHEDKHRRGDIPLACGKAPSECQYAQQAAWAVEVEAKAEEEYEVEMRDRERRGIPPDAVQGKDDGVWRVPDGRGGWLLLGEARPEPPGPDATPWHTKTRAPEQRREAVVAVADQILRDRLGGGDPTKR